MATWIAHLRIAEILLTHIEGLNRAAFAIGNIAPDSGIPDEKWENFNPPPLITHLRTNPEPPWHLADAEFFRRYLDAFVCPNESPAYAFRLGYFFHLVTDNLWYEKIGIPTKEKWPAEFAADKDFIWEVKKDWYGLDHLYARSHPECIFHTDFVPAALPEDTYLDFLPLAALHQNIEHIKEYYQSDDAEIRESMERPFIYLSKVEMDRFVDETAAYLARVYREICMGPVRLDAATTVLAVIRQG